MNPEQLALVALVQMPGYPVLLKYFEEGCRNLETDMLNTDPADEKAVLARHRLAVGAWQLLREVTARINFLRDAAMAAPKPAEFSQKELEELHLNVL
jgi:hypothetical protein